MKERIVDIQPGPKGKKYQATVRGPEGTRKINFGDSAMEQYRDSTPVQQYSSQDHGDPKRRKAYFQRHSGVGTKGEALQKEKRESQGMYTAKILAHRYLW